MSSIANDTNDDEHTPWVDVTPARKRVALTIAYVHGPATFERPDLLDDTKDTGGLEEVIDDKDRVLTSLKYTTLLNKLEEDGYLVKEYQGGQKPIILDLGYDEERDDREAAPFGYDAAFTTVVSQVLERERLTRGALGDVDWGDYNDVIDAVNNEVDGVVLVIVSEASKYRFTKETYGLVEDRVEEALKEDEGD